MAERSAATESLPRLHGGMVANSHNCYCDNSHIIESKKEPVGGERHFISMRGNSSSKGRKSLRDGFIEALVEL
jgi:hypothetical protein